MNNCLLNISGNSNLIFEIYLASVYEKIEQFRIDKNWHKIRSKVFSMKVSKVR